MRQLSSSEDHCPPETTDEALARRARAGCEVAFAELLRRYRPLVHGKARTYFLAGGDRQDVVQEGMIGLYKAIRDFDPDRQPTFRPFADLCVTRQVLSAVKAATRHKHRLLNGSTSLHARDGGEGEPGLQERLADHRGDPLVHVSEATELAQLRAHCREVLSDL